MDCVVPHDVGHFLCSFAYICLSFSSLVNYTLLRPVYRLQVITQFVHRGHINTEKTLEHMHFYIHCQNTNTKDKRVCTQKRGMGWLMKMQPWVSDDKSDFTRTQHLLRRLLKHLQHFVRLEHKNMQTHANKHRAAYTHTQVICRVFIMMRAESVLTDLPPSDYFSQCSVETHTHIFFLNLRKRTILHWLIFPFYENFFQ